MVFGWVGLGWVGVGFVVWNAYRTFDTRAILYAHR